MTKKRTSAKPKAKQGKKVTDAVVVDEAPVEAEVDEIGVETTAPLTTAERRAQRMKGMTRQELRTQALEVEYAYVVKDLRRVLILAGIMFAGLIAVNLAFTFFGS